MEFKDDKAQHGLRFLEATVLNLVITAVEFGGGLLSGSLALLSDAIHNLGDSASIVMAYVASRISQRNSNQSKTYGYRRAEILSSYFNAIFLLVMSALLIWEAIRRFAHPHPVNGGLMLVVAVVGLLANGFSAWLLHSGSHNNLNLKATYLHILSDAFASGGVILGALIIKIFHVVWADPLMTIVVSVYIAYKTIPIIIEATNILMEAGPRLDYRAVKATVLSVPGVVNIHHVHTWMIDEHRIMLTAHIALEDQELSEVEPIYQKIRKLLKDKYNIEHATLQAEVDRGKEYQIFTTNKDDV
ncbi:cation diffusion facilitator family transporter [Pediococcus acidilactici]|jgi:cobalt-zinc-cadmium efflux system protein|uniref:Cation diffusion facilitator family transporter n=1 Tax=Pediococcus acidilactici DSM 20284 TaxID=862514 RepID=E0NFH1_PEDAC|nr:MULTISPECIES: cation diffusion facilitator family transporter [Pediococcus]AZP91191.1 cation transporter [Pediococcus acidilactici]EFL95865.1 cation diffusion facilitator family transporter [Pediococcus acidilactici DSM 20284]KAF0366579.1 cation diffusion facilitator family transporter [Pediococcus acidilactici]KAF0372071.1 cation diffusion facilitator family transporter [Pediococcus acidilactici]KAF0382743.1 cation diffusion facilitator family transporter [Pediococcus acidilactici]